MSDLFEEKNISPMLLYQVEPFDDPEYIFELKLDGIRLIAYLDKQLTVLRNKRNKDVTDLYPELNDIFLSAKKRCILDGELVCFTDGKPDFFALQGRSLMGDKLKIKLAARANPVQFVAYDILYLDNTQVTDLPLTERKKLLSENIKEGNGLSISRYIEEHGIAFFNLAKEQGLEGIVAKKKTGKYHIGKRTRDWVKIKVLQDEDLYICGYQPDENGKVKDVILCELNEKREPVFRGKMFLGISDSERVLIKKFAEKNLALYPYFPDMKYAVFMRIELMGNVQYMQRTENGGMRQPVWKGIKD
ncbi:hypothetical protein EOM82_00825 [bacterium]|nr:hypothetical protein [bacterium]